MLLRPRTCVRYCRVPWRGGGCARESTLRRTYEGYVHDRRCAGARCDRATRGDAYVIAGVGLYHQWNELIEAQERTGLWADVRAGLSAGIGYTFQIRRQEVFLESRYHTTGFESRI